MDCGDSVSSWARVIGISISKVCVIITCCFITRYIVTPLTVVISVIIITFGVSHAASYWHAAVHGSQFTVHTSVCERCTSYLKPTLIIFEQIIVMWHLSMFSGTRTTSQLGGLLSDWLNNLQTRYRIQSECLLRMLLHICGSRPRYLTNETSFETFIGWIVVVVCPVRRSIRVKYVHRLFILFHYSVILVRFAAKELRAKLTIYKNINWEFILE